MNSISKSNIEDSIEKYFNCSIKQVPSTSLIHIDVTYDKKVGTQKFLGIFKKIIYETCTKKIYFTHSLTVTSTNRIYNIINDSVDVHIAYDDVNNIAYWKYAF